MPINVEALMRSRELEAEKAKLLEIRRLRQENGIEFYRPHLKQHKFHTCPLTGRYCRTGNRFGKSEMGIAEDISWALGGRLWYRHAFDILNGDGSVSLSHPGGHNHPFVTAGIPQRPVKGLILVVDWDMAKKIFTNREGSYDVWGKFWKLVPAAAVGKVTNGGRGDRIEKIEIKRPTEFGGGSSTISFDTVESYKHNKMGAESADWDFIHVDEPVPEQLFKAHARGLMDRNGSEWFTCTPLDQMWINDRFCPPGQNIVNDANLGLAFGESFIITGSTYDNPYRDPQGVARFEATLTREEKECRISGLPLAFAGLIYREFIHDIHVLSKIPQGWTAYDLPPKDYTIRVAWDVHTRLPQALLYAATAPNGDVFIYHEQFYDSLIEPNAKDCWSRLQGRNVPDMLIDPYAVIESAVTGESVLDELMNYELWFEKASKDLTTGISKVREKLREEKASGTVRPRQKDSGLPSTIYFSPHLTETLFEFSHYVYDSDKNKPKDGQDHMMENLYRLVLNGLDYVCYGDDEAFVSKPLAIRHNEIEFSKPKVSWASKKRQAPDDSDNLIPSRFYP